MTTFAQYMCTWIVILVDAVTKAEQQLMVVLVLHMAQELLDAGFVADAGQHLEHRFVSAAMRRSPQGGDAGSDTGKRVGSARPGVAHRCSRGVLLMVCVKDEDAVH